MQNQSKKETAVEWLLNQMLGENRRVWQNEIDEALKMEKAQLESAYENGQESTKFKFPFSADTYYRETYKKPSN